MNRKWKTCCLLVVCLLIVSISLPAFASPMSSTEIKAKILEYLEQNPLLRGAPHTVHDNTRFFTDGSTTWGYCRDCGALVDPPLVMTDILAENRLVATSQAIQSSCTHTFDY